MNPRVALVACPNYQTDQVETALRRALDLLGGIRKYAQFAETVLLKPNLLTAALPEKAVITHPSVFEAFCRILVDEGVHVRYGDSPGIGTSKATIRATGFKNIADYFAADIADFSTQIRLDSPEGKLLKQMVLCPAVIECDGIFSISKLKTHGLVRMTGAIKNLFGCVPGLLKGEYHVRMPDITLFSQALLDIAHCVSPRLHIMDAIVAMSGNGPRSGHPTFIGALLLSDDAVALDRVACRLIHLPEEFVPTLLAASKNNTLFKEQIDILGDPVSSLSRPDFDIARYPVDILASRHHFPPFIKQFITPRPAIDAQKCIRCGLCVQVCPVQPKAMLITQKEEPPTVNMDRCIRCYCCQELCPHGAISLTKPWLGRWLHKLKKSPD